MICPVSVSALPPSAKQDWTVFILTLSITDDEFATVADALHEIHPEMLLFTRRLRQLEISVSMRPEAAPARSRLYRLAVEANNGIPEYNITSRLSETRRLRYLREEWIISDMPDHPKRRDIRESKIILAFPFDDEGPIVDEQKVFAFMPLYRTPLTVSPLCPLLISFSFKEIS